MKTYSFHIFYMVFFSFSLSVAADKKDKLHQQHQWEDCERDIFYVHFDNSGGGEIRRRPWYYDEEHWEAVVSLSREYCKKEHAGQTVPGFISCLDKSLADKNLESTPEQKKK